MVEDNTRICDLPGLTLLEYQMDGFRFIIRAQEAWRRLERCLHGIS